MDIKNKILIFDGAMGTVLLKKGFKFNENFETLNITQKNLIKEIHKDYIDNGAMIITTNTFGANELKLNDTGFSVEEVIDSAVNVAKEAKGSNNIKIALDLGPIGHLLEYAGTKNFKRTYEVFKRQVVQGQKSGVDLFLIETMTDINEAKAAILAVKENSNLPLFCTMAFNKEGRTFNGCTPEEMVKAFEELGVDAIGVNCIEPSKELISIIRRIRSCTCLPIIVQPNLGIPREVLGEYVYDMGTEEFGYWIKQLLKEGVNIIGGCCGTTPKYIKEIKTVVQKN